MPASSPSIESVTDTSQTDRKTAYDRDGFLLLRQAFDPSELDPIIARLQSGIDELIAKHDLPETPKDLPFEQRLAAAVGERPCGLRSWDGTLVYRPEIYELATKEVIVDAVRAATGGSCDFTGGFHVRPKLPRKEETAFPWHQDSQYYGAVTVPWHIITVWVPLVPVDEENGCLWIKPGSHRWGFHSGERGSDMNIRFDDDSINNRGDSLPVPMNPGDVLLFSNLTVHGSKLNRSNGVRWSIDLRYVPDLQPDPEETELIAARDHLISQMEERRKQWISIDGKGGKQSLEEWQACCEATHTRIKQERKNAEAASESY